MSTPSNSAYGSGAAKTKAHWLAVKNAMHFSSSLPRSPTRNSSSAMSIYTNPFKAAVQQPRRQRRKAHEQGAAKPNFMERAELAPSQ
jgi:hypothetical protein